MQYDNTVIIPSYNGRELLEENLPSIIKASQNPNNKIRQIIIVDDGSTDDTIVFIKNSYSQVKVIKHSVNRRFSAAVNTGVRASKSAFIVLLNNDVKVTPNFLVKPLRDLEDKNVFAVSLHEKGYGGSKGKIQNGFVVHEGQEELSKTTTTFWASGGSCVINKKIFRKLGGFDEDLFSPFYWEDIDLSYRALKRGYKILWEPDSLVYHNHESTNKNISKSYRTKIQERNQLLFIWKNITSTSLLRKHYIRLVKRIIRHPGYILVFYLALTKLKLVLKRRKKESKEAKVSDEAIFSSFS